MPMMGWLIRKDKESSIKFLSFIIIKLWKIYIYIYILLRSRISEFNMQNLILVTIDFLAYRLRRYIEDGKEVTVLYEQREREMWHT